VDVNQGTLRSGGPADLGADDDSYLVIDSEKARAYWIGKIVNVPRNIATLEVTYKGKNSRRCFQRFAIRDWGGSGRGTWDYLDQRGVSDTEVELRFVPPGAPWEYVGGHGDDDGPVWLKVECLTRRHGRMPFTTFADWMEIAYTTP
jgi:hypothetical protein